ncbi:helix-turn-helix domain-containing protein [Piscirickettsia salmonis]|uniref:helix-turn-helix domain-containing protein n=1 Tax=Piscirickettsia salmonis TaxID=1238 RepID=UPI003EBB2FD2
MSIVERLNFTLNWINIGKTRQERESALSVITGRSVRTVEEWLYGTAFPSSKYLKKIAEYTNLRYSWLQSGEGEAFYYKKTIKPKIPGVSYVLPVLNWDEIGKVDILTYHSDIYITVLLDNIDTGATNDYTDLYAIMIEQQDQVENIEVQVGDFLICKPLLPQSTPPSSSKIICQPINMDRAIYREYIIKDNTGYYVADVPFIRPIKKSKPSEIKSRVIGHYYE